MMTSTHKQLVWAALAAGIAVLSGVNTYAGATVVSSGTLLINGSLANSSSVSVSSAATLGGSVGVALTPYQIVASNAPVLSYALAGGSSPRMRACRTPLEATEGALSPRRPPAAPAT